MPLLRTLLLRINCNKLFDDKFVLTNCMNTHTYTHNHLNTYTCTHTHKRTYTHTYTHIHTHMFYTCYNRFAY